MEHTTHRAQSLRLPLLKDLLGPEYALCVNERSGPAEVGE